MHLERNLNPVLSTLYIVSGLAMIVASLFAFRLLGTGLAIAVIICGALAMVSGYLRH